MQSNGSAYLLRKPTGVSSFAALGVLKRELGTRKVGHTGTLDPFASGLMLVLTGYSTRLAGYFSGLDKRYRAVFRFGITTDTLDPEGRTTATGPIPDRDAITDLLREFTGTIVQRPPRYSAVKIGGKRAYRLARSGEMVEPAPREVDVLGFELVNFEPPEATFEIHCSKGTYIRSLARDLASRLETVAYVRSLERTEVGRFSVDDIPEDQRWLEMNPVEAIRKINTIPVIEIEQRVTDRARNGGVIDCVDIGIDPRRDGEYAIIDSDKALVAVVRVSNGRVTYRFVVGSRGRND